MISPIKIPHVLQRSCRSGPLLTAGEFWSYWLQYLAFFAIFRNFLFILFRIAAIKSNVLEWKPDPKLYLGKFSYHAGPIFTHIPAPEKRRGCKISEMAPFDLDEFLPEMPFLILRRFIYSFGPPFLYKQEKYWKYWLQYLAGPAITKVVFIREREVHFRASDQGHRVLIQWSEEKRHNLQKNL